MNPFEQASRDKLRFDLQGQISVEQLWDVKIGNLIQYEEGLTETVESYGKSTRRKAGRKTKEQEQNELRLQVVSSILDTRIKEEEDAASAALTKAHNQKIMDLIAAKQDEDLKSKSVDELKELLK
jgi:hypothetical protein